MSGREDAPSAAELLRRVLELVESGELEANTPAAKRLLIRIQGAQIALGALDHANSS